MLYQRVYIYIYIWYSGEPRSDEDLITTAKNNDSETVTHINVSALTRAAMLAFSSPFVLRR